MTPYPPDDHGPRNNGPTVDWDCHLAHVERVRKSAFYDGAVIGGGISATVVGMLFLFIMIYRG